MDVHGIRRLAGSMACLLAIFVGGPPAHAATEEVVRTLTLGVEGWSPRSGVVEGEDGNFYGAVAFEAISDWRVFRVTPGGDYDTVATVAGYNATVQLRASDGSFYGSANGPANAGYLFRVTPGGEVTVPRDFSGEQGSFPATALVQASDGSIYGALPDSGIHGKGVIFRIAPGGEYSVVHTFSGPDGSNPASLVAAPDGGLYGLTAYGGADYTAVLFQITGAGDFVIVSQIDGYSGCGNLVLADDGSLFGTCVYRRATAGNLLFRWSATGGLTAVREWEFKDPAGHYPTALLVGADGNLFGTMKYGGAYDFGTAFRATPAGQFTVLHDFGRPGDGGTPVGLIQSSDGRFYGATEGAATVFRITTGRHATATALSLSPHTATPYVGTRHCVIAQVVHADSPAERDIEVTFTRTGINPATRRVENDASGAATECWVSARAGTDDVLVQTGSLADSAHVEWLHRPLQLTAAPLVQVTVSYGTSAPLTPSAKAIDGIVQRPVMGLLVHFHSAGKEICQARTDISGTAQCTNLLGSVIPVLRSNGYTAVFDGNDVYAPASAVGRKVVLGQLFP